MEPVETIQISPTVRVQLFHDDHASNPLDGWDHGIQFITLPYPSRSWRDYKEPTSNTYGDVPAFDPVQYMEDYREYEPGYDENRPHMMPSLRTELDRRTAAWGTLDRNGYDGTLSLDLDPDDITDHDAIALVSRDMYRAWHMVPEGKPMPRGYRQRAAESLQAVIDEYNRWATGECYGYQVQRHAPDCDDCEELPVSEWPATDCDGWEDTDDSCWGFIGCEYATEAATEAGMLEAGIPIPQVTPDRKGITLEKAEGVPNTESPTSRILYPVKPDPASRFNVAWRVRTELRQNPREYREGYNTYTADHIQPEYIHGTDRVCLRFIHPTMQDSITMHRLSWESAQRTMRHLASVAR